METEFIFLGSGEEYQSQLFNISVILTYFKSSRGAFIARVLSSMIDRVGLLNAGLEEMAESAWSIYSAWEYAAQPSQPDYTTTLIDEYKRTFSRGQTPQIEFAGLFDCVNSVGLLRDRLFPLSTKSGPIKSLSHAVSIDERRGKYRQNLIFPFSYKPSLFSLTSTPLASNNPSNKSTNAESSISSSISSILLEHFGEKSGKRFQNAQKLMKEIEQKLKEASRLSLNTRLERIESTTNRLQSTNSTLNPSTDKEKLITGEYREIWFPGNHGDVGGGWASDINGQFLSHVPLRWMFGEAVKNGVIFQKERLVNFAHRYSSLDSLLSCNHDMLSFFKGGLTHEISKVERETILELSQSVFDKRYVPDFRSCEVANGESSFEELLTNGVYLNSLKKIKFDLFNKDEGCDPHNNIDIFTEYKDVPTSPIQGYDGRGNATIWNVLAWWIVEFLPIGSKIEDENDKWKNCYIPNLGRPRSVPGYSELHWSVYWRMRLCYDYIPRNLPGYVEKILQDRLDTSKKVVEDDDVDHKNSGDGDRATELIRKRYLETKLKFKKWEVEEWKKVPDDLNPILKEYGYI